jgi:histidine triad (HIT) family protein
VDFYCDQIISGRIPVETLYVSQRVMAFRPPVPLWEAHIIVIPRKHISSLADAASGDQPILVELLGIVARFSREVDEAWGGCRITTETGDQQVIPHLQFVICAGASVSSEATDG